MPTSFLDRSPEETQKRGTYLNIIKALYNKPIANTILTSKKVFTLKSKARKYIFSTYTNIVLGILVKKQ